MDINELVSQLRAKYPNLSFRVDDNKLFVNNEKFCILGNSASSYFSGGQNVLIISDEILYFIDMQIRELIPDAKPKEDIHTLKNVSTIGMLRKAMDGFGDNMSIIGNCVDKFDNWYTYPCYIAKTPGDNKMVTIQLKPINENQITDSIKEFRKQAEKLAYQVYKKTGTDIQKELVVEIMKLIGQ